MGSFTMTKNTLHLFFIFTLPFDFFYFKKEYFCKK